MRKITYPKRMMDKKLKSKIRQVAEKEMRGLGPSHDFSHVERVLHLAKFLARKERAKINHDVLEVAVYLHDIGRKEEDADSSGSVDHAQVGARKAEKLLREMGCGPEFIRKVKHCILTHRLKTKQPPKTWEAKILADADRLDSYGATGIARICCWLGENKALIWSPFSLEEYAKRNLLGGKISGRIKDKRKHALNLELQMKISCLRPKFYTNTAKKLAKERLAFMKKFLSQLEKELKQDRT